MRRAIAHAVSAFRGEFGALQPLPNAFELCAPQRTMRTFVRRQQLCASSLVHVPGSAYQSMSMSRAPPPAAFRSAYQSMYQCPLLRRYGVDFVVDDSLMPWLLEFNPGPDMALSGDKLPFIERVIEDHVRRAHLDMHPRMLYYAVL